jgi:hypothetical protein
MAKHAKNSEWRQHVYCESCGVELSPVMKLVMSMLDEEEDLCELCYEGFYGSQTLSKPYRDG